MKKRVSAILLSMVVIASGCGNEDVEKKEIQASVEETSATEQPIHVEKELVIKEKIDQLGNEPLSSEIANYSETRASEKNGYTYIVEPLQVDDEVYPEEETGKPTYQFSVSVLKDNEWKIKQQIVDVSDKLWDTGNEDSERTNQYVNLGDTVLVITKTITNGTTNEKMHKISFDENATVVHKILQEKTYKDGENDSITYSFVDGNKDTFIYELNESNADQPTVKLYNSEGEVVVTLENKNQQFPVDQELRLFDEDKGLLFFKPFHMNFNGAKVYDIKADDLVWNEDGSEKEYKISISIPEAIFNTKNGLYVYASPNSANDSISFVEIGEESAEEISSVEIDSELPFSNIVMSKDDKNIYVYPFVEYKGQPTVQKYVIPRIDK